tara:strand:+ start:309 stop:476 length:168 start_codon:yes stop_codon:yes gene_type:complete
MKIYHIYLREEVLFKDLNQSEFDLIWGRLYHSYYKNELDYECILFDSSITADASY